MNIIELDYEWNGELTKRSEKPSLVVLHHAGGSGMSAEAIHKMHIGFSWVGIGYHFYVRKDGLCYRGRPIDTTGAHCYGYNTISVGICAEGNFEIEAMGDTQKAAVADVLRHVLSLCPGAEVVRHKDRNATSCPGANYPFDDIVALASSASPLVAAAEKLRQKGVIQSPDYWTANAVSGKLCAGEFTGNLIRNFAGIKAGQALGLNQAVAVITALGIIASPEYWTANAVAGGQCKGEYVALLMQGMAKAI